MDDAVGPPAPPLLGPRDPGNAPVVGLPAAPLPVSDRAASLPRRALPSRPSARPAATARPAPRASTAPAPARPSRPRPGPQPAQQSPRLLARSLLASFGWDLGEFHSLDLLWTRESGWDQYASNPNSGAYGIPQAVPGSAMASAGPDWRWNARTQILWGMRYIRDRYGSPDGAWQHECSYGWY